MASSSPFAEAGLGTSVVLYIYMYNTVMKEMHEHKERVYKLIYILYYVIQLNCLLACMYIRDI